ncbi:hypothetical protein ACFVJS_03960 [Nocardioides sp. NPDC057772]|uniref:hypothetical protein n=1 Tax=Nocardioides sp. NPDC057772 TaxID=3346245 RepID=UPI0036724FCD
MTGVTDTSITDRDPDGERRLHHDGTPMATYTGYAAESVRHNWDMASVPVWLVSADDLNAHAAAELNRQAAAIRQRIATHGVGMRHGCDTGRSNYCEAWRLILADIEARARALASRTVTTQHDTTNEENPCSTRP